MNYNGKGDGNGFDGTEYNYPILYAIKGVTNPDQLRDEDLTRVEGRLHIDALWLAEIEESREPDKGHYFITDDEFRSLCIGLNEGTNGWALLVGLDDETSLSRLEMAMRSSRLGAFAYGKTAAELDNHEFEFIDLGPRETGFIYFGQLLVRYALIYARDLGGVPHEISHSIEEYAPGVILLLGEPGEEERTLIQGLLGVGVPIISLNADYGLIGHINTAEDIHEMMERLWELPNIRARLVTRASAELPVPSGPVYGRESLTKKEVQIRVQSSKHGFMVSKPSDFEEDDVRVNGSMENASGFSILVELGNPKVDPAITMWVDAIVRRVSKYAKGVKVLGRSGGGLELQITGEAHEAGFTLDHLGRLIMTELRNEFPAIGPIRISFILDSDEEERLQPAIDSYKELRRDQIDSASEENLDYFFGCTRCRSFSLAHACTVTPDRPAQCSKPWYMLKAYAVLAPDSTFNPCTLIEKGECLDLMRGEYTGVNASTERRTEGRVKRVYLHTIFEHPHTSCSCFQNIAYYIPELDGIAIMNRGYTGKAPGGVTWTNLANMVAGRQYQGGAATIATKYLHSPKFLQADGGYQRVVWMTERLKTFAGDAIPEEYRKRIATEKDATTINELKSQSSS
ncbi:MAG: hypothetical protein ACLFVP_05450 [Candidatus Bathyarchaeia archaeon]